MNNDSPKAWRAGNVQVFEADLEPPAEQERLNRTLKRKNQRRWPFRKIHVIEQSDFMACTVATTVLLPETRILDAIAVKVIANGYSWCVANRDPKKNADWWRKVEQIEKSFCWDKFMDRDDPNHQITAKVHQGSLEFGSIKLGSVEETGGGCHRCIALAVAVRRGRVTYRPFDILLHCDENHS